MKRRPHVLALFVVLSICVRTASRAEAPASLSDPSHAYDHIIVAPNVLAWDAQDLADHRTAHGIRSIVVRSSDIATEFGGGVFSAQAIRNFLLSAYANWKVAPTYLLLVGDACYTNPTYNLVPTFYYAQERHLYPNENDQVAFDYGFAEPVNSADHKPILHVGRIPARTIPELNNVIAKIITHETAPTALWHGRYLMTVGDVHHQNAEALAEFAQTMTNTELSAYAPSNRIVFKASDFESLWGPQAWVVATDSTRVRLNNGVALMDASGQSPTPITLSLVYCTDFDLGGSFTQSLAPTNRFPILFSGTCAANFFYWDWPASIGEDFLMAAPNRGAIGVVSTSHINYPYYNQTVEACFLRSLLKCGLTEQGAALTATRVALLADNSGFPRDFLDEYCLLGDPATRVRITAVSPLENLSLGAEIEEPIVSQADPFFASNVTGQSLRIVHNDGSISPIQGERMIRVKLTDPAMLDSECTWRISTATMPIVNNMLLRFWLNVVQSPNNKDRVCVDVSTTAGSASAEPTALDQYGQPLNTMARAPIGPGWHEFYVDLGAFAGETLTSVSVVYRSTNASESGELIAYLDGISIAVPNGDLSNDEILNGQFEGDSNADGVPDAWTDLAGNPNQSVLRWDAMGGLSGRYLVVTNTGSAGAQQLVTYSGGLKGGLTLRCRSSIPTSCDIRVVNAATMSTIASGSINVGSKWGAFGLSFVRPAGANDPRLLVRILPLEQNKPVFVDDVRLGARTGSPISGIVFDSAGTPVRDLTVRAVETGTGLVTSSQATDPSGYYQLSVPDGWSGTIQPLPHGYMSVFAPTGYSLSAVDGVYAQRSFEVSQELTQWSSDGLMICSATGKQENPACGSASNGDAILTWVDWRGGDADLWAQKVTRDGVVRWKKNGVAAVQFSSNQTAPAIAPDGLGGAFIAWVDSRAPYGETPDDDISMQHLDANGNCTFSAYGAAVTAQLGHQRGACVAVNSSHEAFVAWSGENEPGVSNRRVYAQKVTLNGIFKWQSGGLALSAVLYDQLSPAVCADNVGGAHVVWREVHGSNTYLYSRKIGANGSLAGSSATSLYSLAGSVTGVEMSSDGAGGAFVAWECTQGIFLQRLLSDGSVGWTSHPNGLLIHSAPLAAGTVICSDGIGGAYVAWADNRAGGSNWNIFAQHITSAGSALWPYDGVAMCTNTARQDNPQITLSGGSLFVVWTDQRNVANGTDLFMQGVTADGMRIWGLGALPVIATSMDQTAPTIGSDGQGGVMVAWQTGGAGNEDIVGGHVAISVKSGAIAASTTWSGTIFVTRDIVVKNGATLTISEGADLRVSASDPGPNLGVDPQNVEIRVQGGTLNVVGSAASPVKFQTRDPAMLTSNDKWAGICIGDSFPSVANINFAEIRNAARGLTSRSPVILRNSIIEDCKYIGITIAGDSTNVDTVLVENSIIRRVRGGGIGINALGKNAQIRLISCTMDSCDMSIEVYTKAKLYTHQSTVKNSTYHGVKVYGGASANLSGTTVEGAAMHALKVFNGGTAAAWSSTFRTSDYGLELFGSWGPGNASFTNCTFAGNQVGAKISAGGSFTGTGCQITGNVYEGVYCFAGSDVLLSTSTISSNGVGVSADACAPELNDNTFSGNGIGVICDNVSAPVLRRNKVWSNGVGMFLMNDGAPNIDACGGSCPSTCSNANSIKLNNPWQIYNENDATADVECNYWGGGPPAHAKVFGPIDYAPYLTSDPLPALTVELPELPKAYSLSPNYPNPFNPATTVAYAVPAPGGSVQIRIYNVSGQLVKTLVNANRAPGTYQATWVGNDEKGSPTASGIYFLDMVAPGFRATRKILMLK